MADDNVEGIETFHDPETVREIAKSMGAQFPDEDDDGVDLGLAPDDNLDDKPDDWTGEDTLDGGSDSDDDADDDSDDSADDDSDDSDDSDDDSGDDDSAKAAAPKKGRNKTTAKERFSQMTSRIHELERALFAKELESLEGGPAQAAAATQAAPPITAPDPNDETKYPFGAFDDNYIKDRDAFVAAQAVAQERQKWESERQALTMQQQQQQLLERKDAVMADGAKKHGDKFARIVDNTPFPPEIARMVLSSDQAVDIAYFLGNNIEELRRLAHLDPQKQAIAIGRLEGRFSAPSAARTKKVSNGPKATDTHRNKGGSKQPADGGKYGPSDLDDFEKAWNSM